ncbi:AAA family ATPase [Amycolatopsis sp. NPDC059021]|uniref:AAA family ATPase n=1 Tax=Amycolatopsis sp. NPDC059021 TaxID=3346704 RepID=UPI00366EEF7A
MADQRLTSIEIEGFTSIRSARVELSDLNVLVGANGAGKSNFIRAFELLGRMAERKLGLFVGVNGGANMLLNHAGDPPRIRILLDATNSGYEATLVPTVEDAFVFESEGLRRDTADSEASNSTPGASGYPESQLHEPRAIELLQGCRVFHFHDTSFDAPVKTRTSTADNVSLRSDAGNLAAVLLALRTGEDRAAKVAYRRIVGAIRLVAPFFDDFVLQPEGGTEYIRIRWQQQGSDAVFSANQMSDGTLRFVCLATLLLQPKLPGLVVLDEPELGLHPYAIVQLADMLRQAAARSQVLIATQSVTLMNQFTASDLVVVERENGNSVFTRPEPAALRNWLDEYSLGELWEKNLIGGQPGSTGSVLNG